MKKITHTQYPSVSQVSDAQLVNIVKEIFCTINPKYDFLNHFLSLRRDVAWRRFAVRKMRFFQTYRFLDVATGTCDLAMEAALRYPDIQVVGLDFVEEMMCVGLEKIQTKNLSQRIRILKGDALHIPSPPHCFDVAGIAFGIRNIPDKINALKEMLRVVVPGGQVLVLEMTSPQNPFFRGIYTMYLKRILPGLARAFSPNSRAYHYLWDSIMNFPAAHNFALLMERAGLVEVETHALTLGITHLHIGYKPHMS
ncbi:MAG: ubiquinone/menaquinone biosynthesis methyltransferase [Desulfobacteraceae bacterium]|nr:ubiquinone/menaquinone biosynthesis methyltransferase [Desulfobacteraceae bacterium]